MLICIGNRPDSLFQNYPALQASVEPSGIKDSTLKTYKSIADFQASMKDADGNPPEMEGKEKIAARAG